jgi:hypothetical protein
MTVGDMDSRIACYVIQWVLKSVGTLVALGRPDAAAIQKPFLASIGEAVPKLQGAGSQIQWGDDLGGEDETILQKCTTVLSYNIRAMPRPSI